MRFFERWRKKKEPAIQPKSRPRRYHRERSLLGVLNEMLEQNGKALAGRVHLIGLNEIKLKLGPRWDKSKSQVYTITENIISRHLTSADVYERHADAEYFIVFSEMSEKLSKAKLIRIAKELHEHFLGSDDLNDIRVTTALAEMDGSVTMKQVDLQELANQITENASPVEVPAGDEVAIDTGANDDAEADTDKITQLRGHNANEDDVGQGAEQEPETAEINKGGGLGASVEAKGRSNRERLEKLQQRFAGFGEKRLHYGFAPVWDMNNQVISTYQVMPIVDLGAGLTVRGYDEVVAESGTKQVSNLDLDVLEYGLDVFGECIQNNFKLFLSFPVHFETVSTLSHCKEYIELLTVLPAPLRQFLYFEIHGLPQGVPFGRLSDICSLLKPHCRGMMVQVGNSDFNFRNFSEAGIGIVILHQDLSGKPFKTKSDLIGRFASMARRSGMTPWLSKVEDMQCAVVADKASVHCLSGDAIGTVEEVPSAIRRFTRKDFAKRFTA